MFPKPAEAISLSMFTLQFKNSTVWVTGRQKSSEIVAHAYSHKPNQNLCLA